VVLAKKKDDKTRKLLEGKQDDQFEMRNGLVCRERRDKLSFILCTVCDGIEKNVSQRIRTLGRGEARGKASGPNSEVQVQVASKEEESKMIKVHCDVTLFGSKLYVQGFAPTLNHTGIEINCVAYVFYFYL